MVCNARVLGLFAALSMVVMALLMMVGSAQAQINPFQGVRGPVLNKTDLDAGREAAHRLLGSDPKPIGSSESWSGADSGNAGTLTIERAYRKHSRDCRAIRSRVTYKNGTQRNLLLNACQVGPDWKLL